MTQPNQTGMIKKQKASVAVKEQPTTIKGWIKLYEGEVAKALPSVMTPERFTRIALSAVSNTPELADCTPGSFIGALLNAAQLGLEPNTPLGQAYLIPFKNNRKGITECTFQIGYKGMLDLAYRSGEIQTIQAHTVYENDEFDYELGLDPILKHKPAKANRGKAIYYYAIFKLVNGGQGFQVMSREDVESHARKDSKSFKYGPWQTNFDEMAKKTVMKKLLKFAPLKSEFVRGVQQDLTVKTFDPHEADTSIMDQRNEFEYIETDIEETVIDEETGEVQEEATA